MTTLHLTDDALQLFALCHQAGDHAYLWGHNGDPRSNGTSRWFRTGEAPAIFNSTHNNYFGVLPTTTPGNQYQRAKKGARDVAAQCVLFAEIDDKDHGGGRGAARAVLETRIAGGAVPPPTSTIDSGGGVQAYWGLQQPFILDTPEKRDRADRIQKAWVKHVGSDDGAKDLARVLRVPGTLNFKYNPPRPVTVLEADYSRRYDLDDLEALLPPEEVKPTKVRTPRQASTEIKIDCGSAAPDFDAIAQAATNLKRLNLKRRDTYGPWVDVGMALAELGAIGYNLWELWSKSSPKYNVGCCAEKWQTFQPGAECSGYTLASLARWADEDDPGCVTLLPEQAQRQLEEYKQEEARRIAILKSTELGDREKVTWLAVRTTLDTRMGLKKAGAVRLSGEDVGFLIGRAEATGNRAIRALEEHGVFVCDPVPFTTENGHLAEQMHVLPGPAYDNVALVQPATSVKKRGGARAGAGRKPACSECPPGTVHRKVTSRTVSYYCITHGLIAEEPLPDLIEDYGSGDAAINFDCNSASAPSEAECNFASQVTISLSACNSEPEVLTPVPSVIEDTADLTTAIRCADNFSPSDSAERYVFKTALSWLLKDPSKALDQVPKIADPLARAIIEHLAARATYAQAVTS